MSSRGASGKELKSQKRSQHGQNPTKEKEAKKAGKAVQTAKLVSCKLPPGEVQNLKKCFDLFDSDKSGVISVQELVSGFIALGLEERSKDIVTLVKAYEQKKGYSELGFSEFLDIFSSSDAGFEDSLREVFAAYDKDGKGFIQVQDIKRMTKELGEKYTDMEMELMHYHADQDKDGRITFEEFEALLRRIRK